MGERAVDVVPIEPSIEADRGREPLDERIGGFVEASAPESGLLVAHGMPGSWRLAPMVGLRGAEYKETPPPALGGRAPKIDPHLRRSPAAPEIRA
jgi:FtsP/CotA-like multicopper oxidase with cupredoxin domain